MYRLLVVLALGACGPRTEPVPLGPAPRDPRPVPVPVDGDVPVTPDAPAAAAPMPLDAPVPVPVVEPECPLPPNPAGCPADEPNVNALCEKKGLECVYRGGCCPSPVYACVKAGRELRFEARFYRCE